jgi:hypothetical protein
MNLELAKRAVACKRWRWMPGMLVIAEGYSSLRLAEEVIAFVWRGWPIQEADAVVLQSDCLPDLDDPATLGCLLALVREARNDSTLYAHPYGQGWRWRSNYRDCTAIYGSEIEALVAALEAAP